MEPSKILLYAAAAIVGTIATAACIRLIWLAIGAYKINRAGPRRLRASHHVIWRDPGDVDRLDIANGPGGPDGAPQPPFRFIEEHSNGSQPCVSVDDARGRRWRVKWGNEVRSENFAVRLAWACGYFAETTYFVEEGSIAGARDLQRARTCIGEDCRFRDARFELDDDGSDPQPLSRRRDRNVEPSRARSTRVRSTRYEPGWDSGPPIGSGSKYSQSPLGRLCSGAMSPQ